MTNYFFFREHGRSLRFIYQALNRMLMTDEKRTEKYDIRDTYVTSKDLMIGDAKGLRIASRFNFGSSWKASDNAAVITLRAGFDGVFPLSSPGSNPLEALLGNKPDKSYLHPMSNIQVRVVLRDKLTELLEMYVI